MTGIETLQEAILHFADFENCKAVMVQLRWPDGVVRCPTCDSDKVTWLAKARAWKCYGKHARAKFTLKTGTVLEDSAIGLNKWLPAIWLVVNCKNGISSCELARDLKVTQKTAWFMAHRIRLARRPGQPPRGRRDLYRREGAEHAPLPHKSVGHRAGRRRQDHRAWNA